MSQSETNRQPATTNERSRISSSSNPGACHPYEEPDASTTNREMKTLLNGVLTDLYTTDPSMNQLVQRIVTEIAARTASSLAESASASASDESTKKSKKDRARSKSKSKSSRRNRSKSIRNRGSSKVESTGSKTEVSSKKTKKQKSKKKEPQAASTDSVSSLLSSSPGRHPESILRNRNRSSSIPDSFSNLSRISSLNSMSQKMTETCAPDSREFYLELVRKLEPHRGSICIQDVDELLLADMGQDRGSTHTTEKMNRSHQSVPTLLTMPSTRASSSFSASMSSFTTTAATHRVGGECEGECEDFEAAFEPNQMRCLALVSHNEMKTTMKEFVTNYKHILKKFRLTGTQSTMSMLAEVFENDPDVVFGPTCKSGPLGGDAELVAMMTSGQLGGLLFFQDPMTSHPHQCDIDCLVRQAQVNNTVIATTPTTAIAIVELFKVALMGSGKPEIIPSFFLTMQSPTVGAYQRAQKELVMRKRIGNDNSTMVSSVAFPNTGSEQSSASSTIGLALSGF